MPRNTGVMLCTHWVLYPFPPVQLSTPLLSVGGHVEIVKLLLKAGADIDKDPGGSDDWAHLKDNKVRG
jgi:hypothetical protein